MSFYTVSVSPKSLLLISLLLTHFFFFNVSSCLILTHIQLLVFWFVEATGQTTFAITVSVQKTPAHIHLQDTPDEGDWLCHPQPPYSTSGQQLNLLSLMLIFLGNSRRLLPFLSTTTKSQHMMKGGLLWNIVCLYSGCLPAKISLC